MASLLSPVVRCRLTPTASTRPAAPGRQPAPRRAGFRNLTARRLVTAPRAIPVSGPGQQPSNDQGGDSGGADGQMTAELMSTMQGKIGEALETENVSIVDVYGDGRHVSIDVVSELFEGKSSMQRQRMVYKAIWFELQDAVHAVDSMTTKTPTEVA
mmetsp:Transcript_16223/g.28870  ORF Transcript_16223/g.28870 Transcript_16223/m.28870 type:complete len:156 (-) Transcript_16223:191-658(-)|eukprot:CAMPEP_0177759374 /NCGR_PEP_ID=MMETSP0491_2-20121128/4700_1 /TAXON_ID=63592 /ORGANISM="Tetraselmis chuii, Strain PLY429" /LENGTH=155 /DNA_ID=CAMNT_0019275203 /DNA_START=286 /DNA_END=753 /DNA_ORIENTATION=+